MQFLCQARCGAAGFVLECGRSSKKTQANCVFDANNHATKALQQTRRHHCKYLSLTHRGVAAKSYVSRTPSPPPVMILKWAPERETRSACLRASSGGISGLASLRYHGVKCIYSGCGLHRGALCSCAAGAFSPHMASNFPSVSKRPSVLQPDGLV